MSAAERRARIAEREQRKEQARQRVRRMWAAGLSVREIGRRLGVHHQTARELLAGPCDPLPRRRTRDGRAARQARAAELRSLEGLSLRQIAAELGVSHQTVANDLAAWSAPSNGGVAYGPKRGRYAPPQVDSGEAS